MCLLAILPGLPGTHFPLLRRVRAVDRKPLAWRGILPGDGVPLRPTCLPLLQPCVDVKKVCQSFHKLIHLQSYYRLYFILTLLTFLLASHIRVVNVWNGLPGKVVVSETGDRLKLELDRYREVLGIEGYTDIGRTGVEFRSG